VPGARASEISSDLQSLIDRFNSECSILKTFIYHKCSCHDTITSIIYYEFSVIEKLLEQIRGVESAIDPSHPIYNLLESKFNELRDLYSGMECPPRTPSSSGHPIIIDKNISAEKILEEFKEFSKYVEDKGLLPKDNIGGGQVFSEDTTVKDIVEDINKDINKDVKAEDTTVKDTESAEDFEKLQKETREFEDKILKHIAKNIEDVECLKKCLKDFKEAEKMTIIKDFDHQMLEKELERLKDLIETLSKK